MELSSTVSNTVKSQEEPKSTMTEPTVSLFKFGSTNKPATEVIKSQINSLKNATPGENVNFPIPPLQKTHVPTTKSADIPVVGLVDDDDSNLYSEKLFKAAHGVLKNATPGENVNFPVPPLQNSHVPTTKGTDISVVDLVDDEDSNLYSGTGIRNENIFNGFQDLYRNDSERSQQSIKAQEIYKKQQFFNALGLQQVRPRIQGSINPLDNLNLSDVLGNTPSQMEGQNFHFPEKEKVDVHLGPDSCLCSEKIPQNTIPDDCLSTNPTQSDIELSEQKRKTIIANLVEELKAIAMQYDQEAIVTRRNLDILTGDVGGSEFNDYDVGNYFNILEYVDSEQDKSLFGEGEKPNILDCDDEELDGVIKGDGIQELMKIDAFELASLSQEQSDVQKRMDQAPQVLATNQLHSNAQLDNRSPQRSLGKISAIPAQKNIFHRQLATPKLASPIKAVGKDRDGSSLVMHDENVVEKKQEAEVPRLKFNFNGTLKKWINKLQVKEDTMNEQGPPTCRIQITDESFTFKKSSYDSSYIAEQPYKRRRFGE